MRRGRSGLSEGTRSGWDFRACLNFFCQLVNRDRRFWTREQGESGLLVRIADLSLGCVGRDVEDFI